MTFVDHTPPAFEGVTSTWVGRGATVTFSAPINPGTFTAAAVSLINLANHSAVAVTGVQVVPYTDGRSFDIQFNALPAGSYQLSLISAITDLFGNHLPKTGPVNFQVAIPSPGSGIFSATQMENAVYLARGLAGLDPLDPAAESAMLLSLTQGPLNGQPLFTPALLGQVEGIVIPDLAASLQTPAALITPKEILDSHGGWQTDSLATGFFANAEKGLTNAVAKGNILGKPLL